MKLLKDGKKVIASNLCGIHIPINGMYVTYAKKRTTVAPDANASYFSQITQQEGCGYARIAVTSSQLGDDGKIIFSGMLTASDLIGAPLEEGTVLTTATLVHLDDMDRTKDLFVYSAVLKNNIKIVPGTYIVVNVGISIGD